MSQCYPCVPTPLATPIESRDSHHVRHVVNDVTDHVTRARVMTRRHGGSYEEERGVREEDGEGEMRRKREVERFSEEKRRIIMSDMTASGEEAMWRAEIQRHLEDELNSRVSEALGETRFDKPLPAPDDQTGSRARRRAGSRTGEGESQGAEERSGGLGEGGGGGRGSYNGERKLYTPVRRQLYSVTSQSELDLHAAGSRLPPWREEQESSSLLSLDQYFTGGRLVGGENHHCPSRAGGGGGGRDQEEGRREVGCVDDYEQFGFLSASEQLSYFYTFTRSGFQDALRHGRLPDGSELVDVGEGRYSDRYGLVRNMHGPFWPVDYGPLYPAPKHIRPLHCAFEPLLPPVNNNTDTTSDAQSTKPPPGAQVGLSYQDRIYPGKWRGVLIIYDSERSPRDHQPPVLPDVHCPSLVFESRFESGNLRQARRTGQFEYELVLRTDLYTRRHTQWYYFRVEGALPRITYTFKIINLHKRDSLYAYGMQPLLYSDALAKDRQQSWTRAGHDISYTRNVFSLQSPLLSRDRNYYVLEWKMEFPQAGDVCYLAHCYPYTYTDLLNDLDLLLADKERSKVMKKEVMCSTRSGNSCFLLTISDFESGSCVNGEKKRGVVLSARVHPGETNSSWIMKGLLDYITGPSESAKELRRRLIFKIVPMLNPDGVIVGNYRCSLLGRDLNRNYRHPNRESFPTVWHTKNMVETFKQTTNIILYCDIHGHSLRPNVFMYGCSSTGEGVTQADLLTYLRDRIIPWLMGQQAPDKFAFDGCHYRVRRNKESTGRVVMFRQCNINNSFTMEASFGGTLISSDGNHQFSTSDLEDMGRALCDATLLYRNTQDDKNLESKYLLQLSKHLMLQLLNEQQQEQQPTERQGLEQDETQQQQEEQQQQQQYSQQELNRDEEQMERSYENDQQLEEEEVVGDVLGDREEKQNCATDPGSNEPVKYTKVGLTTSSKMRVAVPPSVMSLSRADSFDGCLRLMQQIGVTERLMQESSSSTDSDSESEQEFISTNKERRLHRRTKNKNKKRKKREKERRESKENYNKNGMVLLPAIVTEYSSSDGSTSKTLQHRIQGMGDENDTGSRRKLIKSFPLFVDQYEGRSNGGIPCFADERLMKRAAKRQAMEEERRREISQMRYLEAMYLGDTDDLTPLTSEPQDNNSNVFVVAATATAAAAAGDAVRASDTTVEANMSMHRSNIDLTEYSRQKQDWARKEQTTTPTTAQCHKTQASLVGLTGFTDMLRVPETRSIKLTRSEVQHHRISSVIHGTRLSSLYSSESDSAIQNLTNRPKALVAMPVCSNQLTNHIAGNQTPIYRSIQQQGRLEDGRSVCSIRSLTNNRLTDRKSLRPSASFQDNQSSDLDLPSIQSLDSRVLTSRNKPRKSDNKGSGDKPNYRGSGDEQTTRAVKQIIDRVKTLSVGAKTFKDS